MRCDGLLFRATHDLLNSRVLVALCSSAVGDLAQ